MTTSTIDQAEMIATTATDEKAFDVQLLDLRGLTVLADFFVIASGRSAIQAKSIAESIEDRMLEQGMRPTRREGFKDGRWVILDYSGIMVHVFRQEEREFYQLENLWADAKRIQFQNAQQ
ncbi:MAG: ribosome silencing factor [Solirubrobacterales bacterium]